MFESVDIKRAIIFGLVADIGLGALSLGPKTKEAAATVAIMVGTGALNDLFDKQDKKSIGQHTERYLKEQEQESSQLCR